MYKYWKVTQVGKAILGKCKGQWSYSCKSSKVYSQWVQNHHGSLCAFLQSAPHNGSGTPDCTAPRVYRLLLSYIHRHHYFGQQSCNSLPSVITGLIRALLVWLVDTRTALITDSSLISSFSPSLLLRMKFSSRTFFCIDLGEHIVYNMWWWPSGRLTERVGGWGGMGQKNTNAVSPWLYGLAVSVTRPRVLS